MNIITSFDRSLASSHVRSSLHSQQLRPQPDRGERGGRGAGEVPAPALVLSRHHPVQGRELLATRDRDEDLCGPTGRVTLSLSIL